MKRSTRLAALLGGVALAIVVAVAIFVGRRNHHETASPADAQELFELRNIGIARLENHRGAEAAEAFAKLVALAPDEPLGWQNLAIAKFEHWQAISADKKEAYAAARKEAFEALEQFKAHVGDT